MTLEKLINLKISIIKEENKRIVRKKWIEYKRSYDELGGQATISDKIKYREMYLDYIKYMVCKNE
jgi:hypothetical protein